MNKITWLQNFGTNIIKSKMSSHFDHFKEDTYSKTLGTSVIYSPLKILTVKIDTLKEILQHPTTLGYQCNLQSYVPPPSLRLF